MISNVNSLAIVTSSICEPLAIVTSHWSIILTLYLWTLSSSQWRRQPGLFSMALIVMIVAGFIVVFCFVFVVEYKLTTHTVCAGVVCAATPGTALAGRPARPQAAARQPAHSCCAGSGSTNHSSADRIVVNSYNNDATHCQALGRYQPPGGISHIYIDYIDIYIYIFMINLPSFPAPVCSVFHCDTYMSVHCSRVTLKCLYS